MMEWYYEIGIRWIPKDPSSSYQLAERRANISKGSRRRRRLNNYQGQKIRSYSFHNFAGPGTYSILHQKTFVLTFPSPTRYESIFWYTGRLQFGGKMLRNKIHAHNNLFEQSLFFAAAPDDLGLTEKNGFLKAMPHIPTRTTSVGFANNTEARRFLMKNLRLSQKRFDENLAAQNAGRNFTIEDLTSSMFKSGLVSKSSDCGFPNAPCVEERPKIICQALGVLKEIKNLGYDRREPTCCEPVNCSILFVLLFS